MKYYPIFFFLLFPIVYGSDCVTYSFEDGFDSFNSSIGACQSSINTWSLGSYSSVSLNPQDVRSETFITSPATSACVSSFFFDMEPGGAIEVNVYFEGVEFLFIDIYNEDNERLSRWVSDVIWTMPRTWQTVHLEVPPTTESFKGFISFSSRTTIRANQIYIDSFRYVHPNYNRQCNIYGDNEEISTTEYYTTDQAITTEQITTENEVTTMLPSTTEEQTMTTEPTDITATTDDITTEYTTIPDITELSTRPSEVTEVYPSTQTNTPEINITTIRPTTAENSGEPNYQPEELQKIPSFWTPLVACFVVIGFLLACYLSYLLGQMNANKVHPGAVYMNNMKEHPQNVIVDYKK